MHLCISTLINYSPISNMSTPFIWWNIKFVQINELVSYMIHHRSQCLRVYGFGYQYFKSIRRYQLGLKLYLCPCPWAQTHTCIHAHQVWYSQVLEYFVPVAISTQRVDGSENLRFGWVGHDPVSILRQRLRFVTLFFKNRIRRRLWNMQNWLKDIIQMRLCW
jgi:hypothetical protein